MKNIKVTLATLLISVAVLFSAKSVQAATNTQAQQQEQMVQQIVNQQVALYQSAGQALTAEQLMFIKQSATMMVAQQFDAIQAQQAALLQAQQAQQAQAQQLAALHTKQTAVYTVPTQTATSGNSSYVLNKNSKKFHYPYCSSVGDMSPKNRLDVTMSRNDIISQGYVPCKRCNP